MYQLSSLLLFNDTCGGERERQMLQSFIMMLGDKGSLLRFFLSVESVSVKDMQLPP